MFQVSPVFTNFTSGQLYGEGLIESRRTVGDLAGYWLDEDAAMAKADELLYVTQSWFPEPDGTEGAVWLGATPP